MVCDAIKPSWVRHPKDGDDYEMYGCDVSPDGTRLATAGGDGYVRIWSIDAIRNADDPTYTEPRALAHMSNHTGTIHAVKFSPNGKWLASGADDKILCIYRLDPSQPAVNATFGSNEPPSVENWKFVQRLIGHDADIQDIAWSADSSLLVSVGLDSKTVIWSAHTFEKLKTIMAHQSHVKGVAFDPANKFFATASDDRSMKVFNVNPLAPTATAGDIHNNFSLETTVTSCFTQSPLTTYFRRCSWSPDGNHIAAANATNGRVPTIAIINRFIWSTEISLVGHEAPVEVALFSPRLYAQAPNGIGPTDANGYLTTPLDTVIAGAGQDKTLSVWNTSQSKPIVTIHDLATKSITSLAWGPDGQSVFCTSLDGTLSALFFEAGDLGGYVARLEENDKSLQKYGIGRKGAGIVEDVAGLQLEERSKAAELKGAEGRMGALMGDTAIPTTTGSTINSVVPVDTAEPAIASAANNSSDVPKAPEMSAAAVSDPNGIKVESLKQRVTITKDGKKRVAPLLISSSGTGQSSLPQSQLMAATTSSSTNEAPTTILDLSKPYEGLPRGGLAAMLLGNKRKASVLDGDLEDEPTTKRQAVLNGSQPVYAIIEPGPDAVPPKGNVHGVPEPSESLRPAIFQPALIGSRVSLAVPTIRSKILRSLERGAVQDPSETQGKPGDIAFEAINPTAFREPSRIIVSKRGQLQWQDYLPHAVILVTGNANFWGAACEDGSIHVWTPAGRRLLNALVIDAAAVMLECRGWYLLAISAVGMCHVWNIKTLSSPFPPVSLAPVFGMANLAATASYVSGPGLTSAHLNSNGNIIVTLNNGDGFAYTSDLYTWQRISETWWAVGSQYWGTNDSSVSSLQTTAVGSAANKDGQVPPSLVSAGIIPHLERHTTNEVLLRGRAFPLQRLFKTLIAKEGFERLESDVSIAHLENRMAATLQLGAKEEFRLYLLSYAKRIGAEGMRAKVDELLRSLLGGILKSSHPDTSKDVGHGWQSEDGDICGWDRNELLKEVVLILGKFKELQRSTVTYFQILGMAPGP